MSKFSKFLTAVFSSVLVCCSAYAYDAPRGFNNELKVQSIKEIRDSASDKDFVVMEGALIRHVEGEFYEFSDLSGDIIKVKLKSKRDWSHISKDQMIRVEGVFVKGLVKELVDIKKAEPMSNSN